MFTHPQNKKSSPSISLNLRNRAPQFLIVVQVMGNDFEVWEQVHGQLESQSAAVVKKLLAQLQQDPNATVPRLKVDAMRKLMAILQESA